MTGLLKLAKKFSKNPSSLQYRDIEKLLSATGFKQISAKGSHVKFKHAKFQVDIIVPIHNSDCKDFYKKFIAKQTKELLKEIK